MFIIRGGVKDLLPIHTFEGVIRRDRQVRTLLLSLNTILWVSVVAVIYQIPTNPYPALILASAFTGYTILILYRRRKRQLVLGKVVSVTEVKIPLTIKLPFYPYAGLSFRQFKTTIAYKDGEITYYDFERREIGEVVVMLLDSAKRVMAVNRKNEKLLLDKLSQFIGRF